MTVPTPVSFLDFFILEASDYVEQLDGLLDAGGASGPNPDELQRVARALRGSATMAKLPSFSEVAAGIERVGRAMRETGLKWEPELSAVVVAAVDDAKLLLRQARTWGDAEDTRARARVSELSRYGAPRGGTPMASASMQGHDSYLATEAANIGAGLELLATRPADQDAAANVLRRVRASGRPDALQRFTNAITGMRMPRKLDETFEWIHREGGRSHPDRAVAVIARGVTVRPDPGQERGQGLVDALGGHVQRIRMFSGEGTGLIVVERTRAEAATETFLSPEDLDAAEPVAPLRPLEVLKQTYWYEAGTLLSSRSADGILPPGLSATS